MERKGCDQCESTMIQGVYCHEIGCPNQGQPPPGLTTEQAIEQECYSIGEAIGNCLELNEDFIERYCGEKVSEQLLRIPECDREYAIEGSIGEGEECGSMCGLGPFSIVIPIGEIEVQIESLADLADPDDWTINGDCAYCTLSAIRFTIDIETLTEAVDSILDIE